MLPAVAPAAPEARRGVRRARLELLGQRAALPRARSRGPEGRPATARSSSSTDTAGPSSTRGSSARTARSWIRTSRGDCRRCRSSTRSSAARIDAARCEPTCVGRSSRASSPRCAPPSRNAYVRSRVAIAAGVSIARHVGQRKLDRDLPGICPRLLHRDLPSGSAPRCSAALPTTCTRTLHNYPQVVHHALSRAPGVTVLRERDDGARSRLTDRSQVR